MEFRDTRKEMNDSLVLDLQYRFSVVHGGPVMGAQLDSGTPNFDLLGDVAELGGALSREAAPGAIRINSGLQNLLNPVTYDIQTTPKGPKDLLGIIVLGGRRD
jgi:hypothetical protein